MKKVKKITDIKQALSKRGPGIPRLRGMCEAGTTLAALLTRTLRRPQSYPVAPQPEGRSRRENPAVSYYAGH